MRLVVAGRVRLAAAGLARLALGALARPTVTAFMRPTVTTFIRPAVARLARPTTALMRPTVTALAPPTPAGLARRTLLLAVLVLLMAPALQGCAAIREMAGVRQLDFSLDRVSDVHVAGVDVMTIRRYEDLGATDLGRIGLAWAERELPVTLTLHVSARNPEDNVRARITRLDWDLLVRDRETVSGTVDEGVAVEPGATEAIPVRAELDLVRFFDGGMRDLVETALALAGAGGEPADVQLRVAPTVDTPLGPIRYEAPIVLAGSGEDI